MNRKEYANHWAQYPRLAELGYGRHTKGYSPKAANLRAAEQLFEAAETGDLDSLADALKNGMLTDDLSYALNIAAEHGQIEVVRVLLSEGRADPAFSEGRADADFEFRVDCSLFLAAKNGHTEVVRALLETGRLNLTVEDSYLLIVPATKRDMDVLQLLLAALPANDRAAALEDLRVDAPSVHTFLSTYIAEPAILGKIDRLSRLLNMRLEFLSTDVFLALADMHLGFLSADALFALANALAHRNVSDKQLQQLHEQGHLLFKLQRLFRPSLSFKLPVIADAHRALAPFAAVRQADPVLEHGDIAIPNELLLKIIQELVPALPPVTAHKIWKMLRSEVQHGFETLTAASPAERFYHRQVIKRLDQALNASAKAAVKDYNDLYADARELERTNANHLASAAHHLKNAIDDLTGALTKGDAAITQTKHQVLFKLVTYEEQVKSVLGDQEYQKRAHLFETMRSVATSTARELAGFAQAYQRASKSQEHSLAR